MTPLEIAANIAVTASILAAGRNSIHVWWTGLVGCALFVLLFWNAKLYADVTLQGFFILSSVIGWWRWSRAGPGGEDRPVTHADPALLAAAAVAGGALAAGYGALLHSFTDAYAPFLDSLVLVGSLIAQMLMMERKVENWPVWLMVNTLAVPLYASRELYLTAALYTGYWINALVAWRSWRRLAAASA